MYSKSESSTIIISNDTNKIIQEIFHSPLIQNQIGLEQSKKGINSIFDYVSGRHYISNTISFNRGESYISFPKWMKNKKNSNKSKKQGR